ncbi:MAG: AAA family ATPase, partial [Candidatus Woesearchaeota archaeon]
KVLIAMDEFDSLGTSRKRSMESNHSEDRKVLETIMKNLQKAHDKENIYTILMTNEPEICDDAVLRAGRIDKKYFIGLPNEEERKIGFKKAVENINKRAGYSVIRGTNYDNLVELSEGFSYADIFQSVENSVKQRAKEIYESTADNTKKGVVNSNRLENIIKDHNDKFIKKDKNTIGFK